MGADMAASALDFVLMGTNAETLPANLAKPLPPLLGADRQVSWGNAALHYITNLQSWLPSPLATLTREGEPVLEFDDGDCFSSMRFRSEHGQGNIVELNTRE